MCSTRPQLPPFEFDVRNSRINKLKHGIDFVEAQAQALWMDDGHDEIAARHPREQRSLVIGRIGGKYWTAVVARRGDRVRLLSVRRSRAKEVERYERR